MKKLLLALFILIPSIADAGWLESKPVRFYNHKYTVISDVQSQLNSGHTYADADLITTVHECTHGINSRLRQIYGKPSFYCLNNKVFTLSEFPGTLDSVARKIPRSLQGNIYYLYLIQSQKWWNNEPSYILDEFVAYTNGAIARKELGIQSRQETVDYALEFVVYSYYLPQTKESREFIKWNTKRLLRLTKIENKSKDFKIIVKEILLW